MSNYLFINHRVELIGQPTDMSCWSTATSMLLGNQSAGAGSAKTGASGGLKGDYENVNSFAQSHGLRLHPLTSWTIEGIIQFLKRGPFVMMGQIPNGHAVVVGGIVGFLKREEYYLKIYDPWPVNQGNVSYVNYYQMMQRFPRATDYILQK